VAECFQRELKDYLYSEFKDETLKYQRSITDAALARDNKDRVRVILHEMMRRPSLVLKNTGKILQENVQDMTFDTNTRGGFVGSGGKAKLSINPVVLNNKTQGMGTLVHECHHKLNPMPGFMSSSTSLFKYIDEFVAHWKESVITRPGEGFDRSNWVNEKLKLYGSACSDWEKKFDPIKDIEQTGPYAVTDNSAKRTDSPRLEELAKLIKRT